MDALIAGAHALNTELSSSQLASFERYAKELELWNRRVNLTAIVDREGILIRHFLDSLSCLKAFSPGEPSAGLSVIDVGTGAGFPGVPLKIVCPWMRLTL
ncbi:MAG: 16S rRNA (guanine(527)-N(7))-methyltransferase RsmG, partial [Chloroflexi bacterium]|nr:16S rRNA (guanine(527)-N(7))-methyltransferase RsmG [Chloroflexota bacterium]